MEISSPCVFFFIYFKFLSRSSRMIVVSKKADCVSSQWESITHYKKCLARCSDWQKVIMKQDKRNFYYPNITVLTLRHKATTNQPYGFW